MTRLKAPKCDKPTKNGTPCQQPAGKFTDHPGFGPCSLHGGNKQLWQDTGNPSLLEKAQQYMDDPDLFDLRRELGSLKVLYEELLNRIEDDRGDLTLMKELRDTIKLMADLQDKAFKIIIQRGLYMTTEQVKLVMNRLGRLWNDEAQKAIATNPEIEGFLIDIQNGVARRINEEIEMPQLPSVTE